MYKVLCSVEKAERDAKLKAQLADEELQEMQRPHTLGKSQDLYSILKAKRLRQIFDNLALVCVSLIFVLSSTLCVKPTTIKPLCKLLGTFSQGTYFSAMHYRRQG